MGDAARMIAARGLRLAALVPLVVTAGCTRCSARQAPPDAAPAPIVIDEPLLPPPHPWTFVRVRGDTGLALPRGCTFRAPSARADVAASTRFVAEPTSLASLVIADSVGDPPKLTGVAAVDLDPEGATRSPIALPWREAEALPRLAKSGASWIAAIDHTATASAAASVVVWRGGTSERLGEGDGFAAADLACSAKACALLTTRLARVAPPGATVWIGAANEPASEWKPIDIVPSANASDARPLGLAALATREDGQIAGATATLVENGEVVFFRVDGHDVREETRLAAPHGVLDAIAISDRRTRADAGDREARSAVDVAMVLASSVDDEGCPREGRAGLRFERAGQASVEIATPAPALRGRLHRLGRGALALWIAPLGCRNVRRIVYGVLLDARGAPVGDPLPIGDATAFAAASSDDDIDLYVQDATSVTWVRMTCSAP